MIGLIVNFGRWWLKMNNSNYSLRFSRTSREAYGDWVRFEPDHHWAEPYLWVGVVFGLVLLVGAWMVGG